MEQPAASVLPSGENAPKKENVENAAKALLKRLKWSQAGMVGMACSGVGCFVINVFAFESDSLALHIVTLLFAAAFTAFYAALGYQNVSFAVLRRLRFEIDCILVTFIAIMNLILEFYVPSNIFEVLYCVCYIGFVLMLFGLDAIEMKNRYAILAISSCFLFMTCTHLYRVLVMGWDAGVEIYNGGGDNIYYKASAKRFIFGQILTLCISGLASIVSDKDMNNLMFVTDNLHRDHGVVTDRSQAYTAAREADVARARKSRMLLLEISSGTIVEKMTGRRSVHEEDKF